MYRIDISILYIETPSLPAGPARSARARPAGERYRAAVMDFRPESLRGAGLGRPLSDGSRLSGQVDYRLVRNAVLTEFRKGRLSRLDVCDAHPELLRAAVNVGEPTSEDCPICEESKVRLVSYVFGSRLPASGKCITNRKELAKLSKAPGELACYVVEVCPSCCWNHLARLFSIGGRPAKAGRSGG